MDDDYETGSTPPPARPELSKTPSWITLGFLLGAIIRRIGSEK